MNIPELDTKWTKRCESDLNTKKKDVKEGKKQNETENNQNLG